MKKEASNLSVMEKEIEKKLRSKKKHFITLFLTLVYIGGGCVFYSWMEEKPCESEELVSAPDYDEENCVEAWTIIDALYFSMVTMSTVGYGDLTPTSNYSKLFTCAYIIVGISVVFVRVADALGGILTSIEEKFRDVFHLIHDKHEEVEKIDLDGDGKADFTAPPRKSVYWAKHLTSGFVVLVSIQIISAYAFVMLEPDLPFGEAMYHCFVTATTVGYGDVSLTKQRTRLLAFFHIALSVAFLGAQISRIGELQEKRSAQLQRWELLQKQADENLLASLDRDGSGVDKLEFCLGMLIKLGAQLCGSPLEWSDVEPFLQRFEAMDVDGSGRLCEEDLKHMAKASQNEKMAKASPHGKQSLKKKLEEPGAYVELEGRVSHALQRDEFRKPSHQDTTKEAEQQLEPRKQGSWAVDTNWDTKAKSDEESTTKTHLKTFFIAALYIAAGLFFYREYEQKPCESKERLSAPDYDEESCVEVWTVIDALYFSMVTMSTVGYGDLTPSSIRSKVFTCVYIICGISIVFVRVADLLGGFLIGIEKMFQRFCKSFGIIPVGIWVDLDGDGKGDFRAPKSYSMFWAEHITPGCVVLLVIQIISATVFVQLEPDLPFWEAFYHCIVTATTVGYGDVPLTRQRTRLWAFFHIALTVAWLGAFIERVGQLRKKRKKQLERWQLLLLQADENLLASLDHDGNGVDKLEFCIGMLIKLGAQLCSAPLSWSDVEPFLRRFEAMDRDCSGRLCRDDLKDMATGCIQLHSQSQNKQKMSIARQATQEKCDAQTELALEREKMHKIQEESSALEGVDAKIQSLNDTMMALAQKLEKVGVNPTGTEQTCSQVNEACAQVTSPQPPQNPAGSVAGVSALQELETSMNMEIQALRESIMKSAIVTENRMIEELRHSFVTEIHALRESLIGAGASAARNSSSTCTPLLQLQPCDIRGRSPQPDIRGRSPQAREVADDKPWSDADLCTDMQPNRRTNLPGRPSSASRFRPTDRSADRPAQSSQGTQSTPTTVMHEGAPTQKSLPDVPSVQSTNKAPKLPPPPPGSRLHQTKPNQPCMGG